MTLNLTKLGGPLDQMGRELAQREATSRQLLALALQWLDAYSADVVSLRARAEMARDTMGWRGAIPTDEPLQPAHPLPPHPPRLGLVAADGSQIEPDRHGAALYALINIGSIVMELGTGKTPQADSQPILYYTEDDLYEDKRLLQGNLLDTRRDIGELEKLADLAAKVATRPVVTLTDGTLLLWVLDESPAARRKARLDRYLACLDHLKREGAAVAAFTSRPRYADVVNLLHLASLGEGFSSQQLEENPQEGLTDRALFMFLPPGERSALFVSGTPVNAEYRRHDPDHEILFFYMNVGEEGYNEIARVEVPRWVTTRRPAGWSPADWPGDYRLLDLIQAAIYAQCRPTDGYPYVLARAHELALVSVEEQRDLERRVIAAMAQHGIWVRRSEKARLKELTGSSRKRHTL